MQPMIEQLWEKYHNKIHSYFNTPRINIWRKEFDELVSDVLSSQWQTREPTREDGEYILVETVSKDGPPIREIIRREKFVKNRHVRFMSIPK